MHESPAEHETSTPDAPAADAAHRRVLDLRVSELIDRYPRALPMLIDAGFGPLAVPALRATLAPTVTLRQALWIRGQGHARDAELLDALLAVSTCRC